jgi:hypothetical protein
MHLFKVSLCALFVFVISSSTFAADAPQIVVDAFKAYQSDGFEKAFSIWMKGSPLENDKSSLMSMKGGFTQIETAYGKMVGYEIIKVYQITKHNIRTYAVILYEKGPVYMYVDCYKSHSGWIIPELQFHTKPQMVLPGDVLPK